ncbi:MAG: redoxin domain-containing protein [Terracidiphilus sp.]|jgi:peroxiredoxin
MIPVHRALLVAAILLATPVLYAKNQVDALQGQIDNLYNVSKAQRPAALVKLATDIRALPAGKPKVTLADNLASKASEGDPGLDALQAVADTLMQALTESPIPAKKDWPAGPYFNLARLVRYEGVTAALKDPMFAKAADTLVKNEADIEKVDFTLKDTQGKKVTFSQFRGKVVLVYFWVVPSKWCEACQQETAAEMGDIEAIYTHLASQGLVVLAIDSEDVSVSELTKIPDYVHDMGYHLPILLDPGSKVADQFHTDRGTPRSFVINREGKLVAEGINMRTQRQLLNMLALAGIRP